ncbi:MAG: helix-turn-helix domain-containing protein, partial [Lachnospiraceae bacterium]|nr:helix-turn-helix domain-containing protein [Lachnospiraceae bacterium]
VLCEINHQLERYDEELLVFFSEFVRRLYRRMERDELQPREDSFTKIMKRLLNRDSVNEAEMAQSLLLHQWSDSSPCSICCMIPDPAAAREKSLAYYCDRLSEIFPDSCAVEHEQKICLLTILQPHYQSQDDLIARISIFQREANFRAGYSDVFTGFQSLPVYYRQAAIALRIGMAENPTIWNHRFKKYRFSYFQERLTSELPAETLIAEELQQLINYDRQNDTDYVATLRAFLKHDMNVVQTASALFIHRGTMIYRLKRIQELGNISFEDQEQMLYIRMCLRLFMNAENG